MGIPFFPSPFGLSKVNPISEQYVALIQNLWTTQFENRGVDEEGKDIRQIKEEEKIFVLENSWVRLSEERNVVVVEIKSI